MGKEGKEEPEEWPRESAYNLPRLVEAGVCPGRKAGRSTLPQEEEEEGEKEEEAWNDNQSQERVGWPPAKAVPPRSPEHLTQGGGHRGRSACQGSSGRGPLGASGSSRGFTLPGPWGRAVLGQPSHAYANQMGPSLGGLGRTWQDSLPREELDQDRLPEGVGCTG